MVSKLPTSLNTRLIVIQFLSATEPKTGYVLSKNVQIFSPFIETVDFYSCEKADEIITLLEDDIPKTLSFKDTVAIYIDSHGFDTGIGIGYVADLIRWETLTDALKKVAEKLDRPPMLILTACNGIGISNFIDSSNPVISRLYAGEGIMLNGPVMGVFCDLFNAKGVSFDIQDLQKANRILISKNSSPIECIIYM